MAVWQADFELTPPHNGIPADFEPRLQLILPLGPSWHPHLKMFGTEPGHRLDIWSPPGEREELLFRVDVRHPDLELFGNLLTLFEDSHFAMATITGLQVPLSLTSFVAAVRGSPAFRFASTPKAYVLALHEGTEDSHWHFPSGPTRE